MQAPLAFVFLSKFHVVLERMNVEDGERVILEGWEGSVRNELR